VPRVFQQSTLPAAETLRKSGGLAPPRLSFRILDPTEKSFKVMTSRDLPSPQDDILNMSDPSGFYANPADLGLRIRLRKVAVETSNQHPNLE
jgi:hypothetical protein